MTKFIQDGWQPTGMLRFVERLIYPESVLDFETSKILQQLWATTEGPKKAEWRDVPLEKED